jgi:hypothetical protein
MNIFAAGTIQAVTFYFAWRFLDWLFGARRIDPVTVSLVYLMAFFAGHFAR